jgi:hypothetical protein
MRKVYVTLRRLHVFVGLGALAGGYAAITNPRDPLGVSAEILKKSPFHSFFIPGLILFFILGVGNLCSAFVFKYNLRSQGYISSVFSWALVIWIVVQCIMLETVAIPHILFLLIGLVEVVLSGKIMVEYRLYPANIVLDYYHRRSKNRA